MPKFLERDLAASAAKKGKTGRAAARYVYGAMNNMGAMHGNRETAKGRQMDRKHAADVRAGRARNPLRGALSGRSYEQHASEA